MMYEWTYAEIVKRFEEELDMCYPAYEFLGATFFPTDVLKACDPVMYNQELNNYIDYLLRTDEIFLHTNGRYYTQPELEETP